MTPRRARCLLACAAFLAAASAGQAKEPPVAEIGRARFVVSESSSPPSADTGEAVTLPDSWDERRPGAQGYAWYIMDWTAAPTGEAIGAVYLSVTRLPAEVYLNERPIGATGALTGPRPRSWQQSQLFVVPPGMVREGVNRIALRVYAGSPGVGGLGTVLAGPERALRERALRDLFLYTIGPAIMSVTIVVLGLFILVLWLRRRNPTYGLFGLAAVLWGVHTGVSLLTEPLFPQPHWGIAWTSLYMLFVGLLCLFCLSFADVDWPRYRKVVWGYVAVVPIALYAAYALHQWGTVDGLVRAGGIVIVLVALFAVARYALRKRDAESYLLVVTGAVSAAFAVHDWLAAQDPLALRPLMLVPYAGLAFLLLVGWILTDRFVRALNEYETLNAGLEQRVAEKGVELAKQLEETRAARDAAEAADRAKSRFLAAASHDLRQPLHALALFAARLGDRARDVEELSLVQRIQTSVASLESLFSSLLDISKLDAGVVAAQPRAIALEPLFARIANDLGDEALEKGVSLVVRPTAYAVRSDPVLLERILRNLVANAIRYTSHGGVLVGARRRGGRIAIEVWDTGSGIDPAEQHRVFEEFYQVGNPERDRAHGLGLGLAIVRRLAMLLGHELSLGSRPGRGSVFRICATMTEAPAAETVVPGAELANPLAGKRILVVDDEEPVREAMRQTLAAWSSEAIVAGDVEEAIARCGRGGAPDALVVDYRLRAGRDGIDAVARLRVAYGKDVPAIVVSGESSTEHLARIQSSGFLLLHKPVAPAKLRAALAFAIGHSEPVTSPRT